MALERDPRRLGLVVAGSLSKGLEARLDAEVSVEDMAVGRYVVIDGRQRKFFGMITDVRLSAANPDVLLSPPDPGEPLLSEVMHGTSTFGTIDVAPMLTIGQRDEGSKLLGPQPVKTVPSHFAPVSEADDGWKPVKADQMVSSVTARDPIVTLRTQTPMRIATAATIPAGRRRSACQPDGDVRLAAEAVSRRSPDPPSRWPP